MDQPADRRTFQKIKKGDIQAFESLFHAYYSNLCRYASGIVSDDETAEEIVQDMFVNFWEKREMLNIDTSLKNYLYQSVKNRCLNQIKHNITRQNYLKGINVEEKFQIQPDEQFLANELAQKIEKSIQSLPEKRQKIFRMSREEGLKYSEIAERMNISQKTVETQMGLAIKTLREELDKHT